MDMFRTKSLSAVREVANQTSFKRNLGVLDLILLGLGGIIGTGIFVLTGLAAATYAGPGITLSFLIGGIAAIFTALAYSELAAMLPVSGGAYTYTYVTLGEGVAAIIGWTGLMLLTFGGATVAAGWSGYIVGILQGAGYAVPVRWTKIPQEGGYMNAPAVLIIFILMLLLIRGTKEATQINRILVGVKLGAILLFVFSAAPHMDLSHWAVFAPHGFLGIAAGAGFVFMAYTGFDTLAMTAEECKNPNRDLPIGIIGSLAGSALLYILVSGILTAIVPYSTLNIAEPMAFALRSIGVTVGAKIVAAGAIAGMSTVILTQIYGQSRILLVMARDGLLPPFLAQVHSKFASPYVGILATGLLMMPIAGFAPVAILGQLSSMSTLIVFACVSLSVMIMRYKKPDEKRPFKCPAVYLVACVSMFLCLFMFFQLLVANWKPYLLSTLAGCIVYLSYGYRHSTMHHYKKQAMR
jgi:APA family basic amino acid/polyamine antiporter